MWSEGISLLCMWTFCCPSSTDKCPFSIDFYWHLCQKSIDHTYKDFFLNNQFCYNDLYIYSYLSNIFSWNNNRFIMNFEIEEHKFSILVFFFKILLCILGPLPLHINIRIRGSCGWFSQLNFQHLVSAKVMISGLRVRAPHWSLHRQCGYCLEFFLLHSASFLSLSK